MAVFETFVKGQHDAQDMLNRNFAAVEMMTIDGGLFADDPVAAHVQSVNAHTNLVIDGNEAEAAAVTTPLETHEIDPTAHPNMYVRGSEF